MKNITNQLILTDKAGKKVELIFDEPSITSDAGIVALLENPILNRIAKQMASVLSDKRSEHQVTHTHENLIKQRVAQIICGYEDADDCDYFRNDPALKTGIGTADVMASQPTMSRFENSTSIKDLLRIAYTLLEEFMNSYDKEPKAIIIDMDPSVHRTYGDQQMSLFNTHAGGYCLMPFYVYEGFSGKMMTTIIRPGKTPTADEIIAILKRLVRKLRKRWPKTMLIFRADSHHTKPLVMDWMEDHKVEFITGLAPNKRLNSQFKQAISDSKVKFERTGIEGNCYASGYYAAGTWKKRERRVVCRARGSFMGQDTRYVVTSFSESGAKYLYEFMYCGRANCENDIKDSKLGVFSDRSSCQTATANQFRMFLHAVAYMVLHEIRSKELKGTAFEKATFNTIRLRLLKVGARVEEKKTIIRFHLPADYKYKKEMALLAGKNPVEAKLFENSA